MTFPFNVRAYGILIVNKHILLSNEEYSGRRFTKLPGGGLEFGEGLKDTVRREFLEETGLRVEVVSHVYTTDFFQTSAFNSNHQVISVYFKVRLVEDSDTIPSIRAIEPNQHFWWQPISELSENDFTFPIDKAMVPLLRKSGE